MKTALITGASSGIGRALADELAGRGYDLALGARRLDALEQLRDEIRQHHPDRRVELRRLDVTDYDQVPTVIDELAATLGGLDLVIANAGVGSSGPIGHGHAQADRAVIETNVLGAMATIDAAVAPFRRQGRGQIVAISSVAAFRGLPGSASYSASKAAIAVYADALRAELHGTPIKVTSARARSLGCFTPAPAFMSARVRAGDEETPAARGKQDLARATENPPLPASHPLHRRCAHWCAAL